MNEHDQLNVWHGNIHVGTLWRDTLALIGFQYSEKWCEQGFPISQQLPITRDEFTPTSTKAHEFFANLLPEADARAHIIRDLKISNSDDELLKASGGECAGAISIFPLEQEATFEKI